MIRHRPLDDIRCCKIQPAQDTMWKSHATNGTSRNEISLLLQFFFLSDQGIACHSIKIKKSQCKHSVFSHISHVHKQLPNAKLNWPETYS